MARKITTATSFRQDSIRAYNGLAVIYDIGGFSAFFNRPDIQEYIPRYLNHVTKCVDIAIFGGESFWMGDKKEVITPARHLPVHRKFLGDGCLNLWCVKKASELQPPFIASMLNRLWNLQNQFAAINKACSGFIPFAELPSGLRFGVARGTVYELSYERSVTKEYIGVCINLASRLQKYCSMLNFIASARVDLPEAQLEKYGYRKVVATKVKGFPKELVIVDKNEFGSLPPEVSAELFESIT